MKRAFFAIVTFLPVSVAFSQVSGGLEQGLRAPSSFILPDRRFRAQAFAFGAASSLSEATRQEGLRIDGGFLGRFQLGLAAWALTPGKAEFAADLAIRPLSAPWKGFDLGAGLRHLGAGPRQGTVYTPSF